MIREEFDRFCGSLPGTSNVIQWGNASVWKVGGKIFAICSHWGPGEDQKISFKCSDMSYQVLIEQPDIIPAPYLARAKWVQLAEMDAMTEEEIRAYVTQAHKIIAGKLTRAKRRELGLEELVAG
ncbi:MmcQ/YjbR family DNA-binding protein [Aestuariispira insulae]|uniref:Putative DNA-binding protein (MmcQ/YjbR family) n=1 Tax=Aestuariispira insulae TaxID=1461337 RepID=A0A3D9HRC2_9PROT|nr:MmcQ/YjbR family DNA-binding protein [Aestuariispira insulae]RED52053.1 putative DNA-binding protein (MmcQ/YjbR family) [Aestuariispira insulae]